jgi:hypothetical protein
MLDLIRWIEIMKWKHIEGLQPEVFRRLTGVKHTTFDKMVEL